MIDVHMADGRTVFRLRSRERFINLLNVDLTALDESRALFCWVRWHPDEEFVPTHILSIRKASVAFTRRISGEERVKFEALFSPLKEGEDEKFQNELEKRLIG